MNLRECQFISLKSIAEGNAKTPPKPLSRHLFLFVRRHLSTAQERALFRKADAAITWSIRIRSKNKSSEKYGKVNEMPSEELAAEIRPTSLKAGDQVRVRSMEEIEKTLNHMKQTKGCAFIQDVMAPYCGTLQHVLKPMERFVDERELRVKKCRGLILLDGVMCQGTTAYGRCDRSCFVFWREEWLQKVDPPDS